MPKMKNSRINITVTPELLEKIQAYRKAYGCISDSNACVQLIVQRLQDLEKSDELIKTMKMLTQEQLQEAFTFGAAYVRGEIKEPIADEEKAK